MAGHAMIASEEITSVLVGDDERIIRAGGYRIAVFHAPEPFTVTQLGETTQHPAAVFSLWSASERAALGIVDLEVAETDFDARIHDADQLVFAVANGRVTETQGYTEKSPDFLAAALANTVETLCAGKDDATQAAIRAAGAVGDDPLTGATYLAKLAAATQAAA